MEDLAGAMLLGLSFGNLWICALLVFSLQAGGKALAAGYLVGRALAIVALSMAASIVGTGLHVPNDYLNIASGIFLLAFSAYLAATRIWDWVPPWRSTHNAALHDCGDCNACSGEAGTEYRKACSHCSPAGLCEAEEPEVEPLTRTARMIKGRRVAGGQAAGFSAGLGIGAARGAVMCTKLAVLLPILFKSSPLRGAAIGAAFSLSSSVYPMLGFLFGGFALSLLKYKKPIFLVSCAFMAVLGAHYVWRGLAF